MATLPGLKGLEQRKRELLLESEINRQVLRLETDQIRLRLADLRGDVLHSRWKLLAPVAGLLLAWKLRRWRGLLKGSFGVLLLRKFWEGLSLFRPRKS